MPNKQVGRILDANCPHFQERSRWSDIPKTQLEVNERDVVLGIQVIETIPSSRMQANHDPHGGHPQIPWR